ncbi:MAG: hypothetical protein WBW92_12240 [Rhodanobacteraceae bacterium]
MRILMISRARSWLEPPRLLRALQDSGARTAYLAHCDSMLAHIRHADKRLNWSKNIAAHPQDLYQALDEFEPDMLLPADEPAALWLHALYALNDTPYAVCELIARSLGDPAGFAPSTDKLAITRMAQDLGIDTPLTSELQSNSDAGLFVHRHGWPVVIKSRRGFAGLGVYPCGTLSDLRHAHRNCPREGGRLIQIFTEGTTWMTAFVAARGEILAQICFAKLRQFPQHIGPSSIVRCRYDSGLQDATARMVKALGFSGFGSIDFQRCQDGRDLLLEFNPRPTPVCHLGRHLGVDLAAAFVDRKPRDSSQVLRDFPVALFPQELCRDSSGAGLEGCWHDLPSDEPELLKAMRHMLQPRAQRLVNSAN